MSRRKSRLKKLINKLRNWCHIFRRDSTLRNEVPVSAMNKLEWVSYEDIMYEEVRFNNDELSSHASTDDSGVMVGKQEIVPKQSNVIITNAIIENHKPQIYSNLVSATANEENILETNSTERGNTIEDTIKRVQETPTNSIYSIVQKRQKTNPGLQEHLDYIETISNKSTKLSQYVDDGLESREYHSISDDFLSCPRANSDDIFYTLKKMRDIECVRLNQSSNILKAVIEKPERDWKEQLLAETILLENELRYQLIANKIRGLNDHTTVDQHKEHTIDLSLTNFEFEVQQHCPKKNRTTEFFVLAVSHNMELFVTKAIAPVDNKLVFTDKFTFKHMLDCFRVKIEVYSIKLRTEKSMVNTLWKKNTRTLCPIFRIYYENVHTYELHESKILKPSYSLCGAVTVTKENIGNNDFTFSPMMANSSLCMYLNATVFVEKVNLKTNVAGFLAVGKTNGDNNVIYWDRKWCTLRGCEFSIYNYPQDEVFNKPPLANVNLEYCLEKLAFNRSTSKRRSFVLKTGRPSTLEDKNQVNLKYKNNFVIDKYFLAADNSDDFKIWTEELNSALEFLAEWDKLIFGDDYYLIS